ncbi:TatD family hydrolase [Treponema sp.]|uniref:TatD family hydrolase n=1 Tax=Treponema sp. TaxID=166 RepID=UPI0025F8612D|nr:TatD family hydrolase [Treponema sp.]MCR5217122.1 TatD family hydrolase [Treponema sp.]
MYSDTHFHFHYQAEKEGLETAANVLAEMADNNVFFGMDIGTDCRDLIKRRDIVLQTLEYLDEDRRKKAQAFMHFSAGIWPDEESIADRYKCMEELQNQIKAFKEDGGIFSDRLAAIGEGGLDHHWDAHPYEGELFEMQLALAKKMDLPFVVHSRDAYQDTYACIKNAGWNKGIIHCYSYGLEEAKAFLNLGWYISLSGSVTYTKKSKMEDMKKLLAYIPDDRILLETDSPYLAPVPMRGNPNNPNFVKYTYAFVADSRNVSPEELSDLVDCNIKKLFNLK